MNYLQSYESWLADKEIDEETKQELLSIRLDEKEIEDRFFCDLDFGTAGLRGVIGAGTNRMNNYMVGKATQGYANYLLTVEGARERGVTIAYDSRRKSDEFALEAALILCANGIKVNLFSEMRSVPQLSFSMQYLNSVGGIIITASHNPKEYNGYKVYASNGAQIGPDLAQAIMQEISKIDSFGEIKKITKEKAIQQELLYYVKEFVDEAYYDYVSGLSVNPNIFAKSKEYKIIYTPLHGTGNIPVRRVLKEVGFENILVVKEQELQDVDFSTVSAPNPEAADAFDYAKKLAEETGANLMIATDPDADRLGVCIKTPQGYTTLTGNQIGCLLMHYILEQKQQKNALKADDFVVKSIVSTNMANAIAKHFNVQIDEVLTGFRYIGEKIAISEKHKDRNYLFGFEESFGFNAGKKVRDKDAISSALLICELAVYLDQQNKTLIDRLNELNDQFGHYDDIVYSYTLYGKEGLEKISATMKQLRQTPPVSFGALKVKAIRDYLDHTRIELEGGIQKRDTLDMPLSNVLYYELEDTTWVCIRPSGTEPKLKVYINGFDQSSEKTKGKLAQILVETQALLQL